MSYQPYRDNAYTDNQYGGSYTDNANAQGNYGAGGRGYTDDDAGGYNTKYGQGQGGDNYPMTSQYATGGYPTGYNQPKKSNKKKWIWIGLGILALIIIGAVLGGVLGTQLNKDKNKNGSSGSSNDNSGSPANTGLPAGITSANTAQSTGADGHAYLAIATNTYMLPIYATGTNTAGYSAPTVATDASVKGKWPTDPNPPSNSSIRAHPRIIAPGYKWTALVEGGLIASDPYLSFWNATIMLNASETVNDGPTNYTIDGGLGGNGVLDVSREMKLKIKNWAYAYRVTNDTQYAERVWEELLTASGNNTNQPFGADGTRWNPEHFLDLAEFCNVFAIGYDWLYDYWSDEQRDAIMWSILNLGLSFGLNALTDQGSTYSYSWWTGTPHNPTQINGNWNCVCNGGLTLAAIAIIDRDPTGVAQQILDLTVPNAQQNCFQAAYADGTWAETSDYWYFGTSAAGEFVSALITAYGDDRGLTSVNPGWNYTSLFHIYNQGMTSKFNFGDTGPNKFSTTANSLFVWADVYDVPRYALYQRDQYDSPEPWSMFWYDPATSGTWWDGLDLDKHFDNQLTNWGTARTDWADYNGAFWAMKSGQILNHQNHDDMDLGDFVLDAAGQRWFGELGSGQYLSPGYWDGTSQNGTRWSYYRKRTEGQNTVLINHENQLITAAPTSNFGSTGTAQGLAPSFNVSETDTAFYTCDISSAYNDCTVKRGIRFLNGRKQILIQDDIVAPAGTDVQWRANTNATVTVNQATATLVLSSQTMYATIISGPSGASFSTALPTDNNVQPPAPSATTADEKDGNVPNPGVTVLVVDNPNGGDYSLQILFNPQWPGMSESDFVTPPNVTIDNWSLTSHN